MTDLATLSITQARAGLDSVKFSSSELTEAVLRNIEMKDKELNAYLHISRQEAMAGAERYDDNPKAYQGQLAGIPIAVKDAIITKDIPTTAASKILENYRPPYDATVIARLKKGGAVIVGKTNCDEFAMGASGENSAYGPTKNPHDTTRVPGGSSAGSAAAVAADMCLAALGGDTGGSIRQPAGFCGIVGLRPTYGSVSRYGLIAMASSLDVIGPMTKTVKDAALLLSDIAGPDKNDATTGQARIWQADKLLSEKIKGKVIGLPKEYFPNKMNRRVKEKVMAGIDRLKAAGAAVKEIEMPLTELALAAYYVIVPAEVSTNLARYDGIRYGLAEDVSGVLAEFYQRNRQHGFGDETKRRIMIGTYSLSAGYADRYYLQAVKIRQLIINEFKEAFKKVDIIATSTSPEVAFKLGERQADPLNMYLADIFTVPASLAGLPAVSVNVGVVDKLPVGLQLIGPWYGEAAILSLAGIFDKD
ncbi:MAG: Asp-tRNA(Asn)/Glu-tRNA(Gln) amidotransferase subunit GatA [Patescibacteria group bacterium]